MSKPRQKCIADVQAGEFKGTQCINGVMEGAELCPIHYGLFLGKKLLNFGKSETTPPKIYSEGSVRIRGFDPKVTKPAIRLPKQKIALIPVRKKGGYDYALVDLEFAWLEYFVWQSNSYGHASSKTGLAGKNSVLMHHIVRPPTGRNIVDHENRNPKDNRSTNLRDVTQAANMINRPAHLLTKKPITSKYKGVCFANKIKGKPWQYALYSKTFDGGRVYGYTETEEEAALMYNKLARDLHGDFAVLNVLDPSDIADIYRVQDLLLEFMKEILTVKDDLDFPEKKIKLIEGYADAISIDNKK